MRTDLLTLTDTERDEMRARLAEIEARALALSAEIGATLADLRGEPIARNDVPPEFVLPDGSVSHVFEQARRVSKGDWVQAEHGDTDWAVVLHTPVHSEGQTGLVTRRPGGGERIRWWAHTDLVKVAEAPVPDPAAWRAERMGVQS